MYVHKILYMQPIRVLAKASSPPMFRVCSLNHCKVSFEISQVWWNGRRRGWKNTPPCKTQSLGLLSPAYILRKHISANKNSRKVACAAPDKCLRMPSIHILWQIPYRIPQIRCSAWAHLDCEGIRFFKSRLSSVEYARQSNSLKDGRKIRLHKGSLANP